MCLKTHSNAIFSLDPAGPVNEKQKGTEETQFMPELSSFLEKDGNPKAQ